MPPHHWRGLPAAATADAARWAAAASCRLPGTRLPVARRPVNCRRRYLSDIKATGNDIKPTIHEQANA